MSKKPTHADLVKAIKKLILENGGYCYKHYAGGPLGMNGVADLIGVYKSQGIAIEIKTGKDKLTDAHLKGDR